MIESLHQTPTLGERTKTLEASPMRLSNKLTLAYLMLVPQKTGALFGGGEGVGDDPPTQEQQTEFEKDWNDIRVALDKMKIPYLIDRPLGVDEGIYRYRIIAAKKEKDLSIIRDLVNGEETEEAAKRLGQLMGYPDTAIAAYRTSSAFDESDLPQEELQKLHSENLLPFITFKLSREHYRDELNRVRLWQRLVRTHCPKLYNEIIEEYKGDVAAGARVGADEVNPDHR